MPTISGPDAMRLYIDELIVPLLRRVGLRVKVKREKAQTVLTIKLGRAE
ncbi:hypothetical protein ACAG26_24285 [Mycobacterium sp. pUA109]